MKIVQVGITEVVFSRSYYMDAEVCTRFDCPFHIAHETTDRSLVQGGRCPAEAILSRELFICRNHNVSNTCRSQRKVLSTF